MKQKYSPQLDDINPKYPTNIFSVHEEKKKQLAEQE